MRSLICSFLSVVRCVIVTGPLDYIALEGSNLTLFCNITGNPKPDITWTKEGDSSVQSISEEFISNKPEERSKIIEPCCYSCKADNSFEVNASITVMY